MNFSFIKIDHIQLAAPAGSEDQARHFFSTILGLTEIEKPAALKKRGGVWFQLGAQQQLHIGIEDPFSPAKKAHPAFVVHNLNSLKDHLQTHHVPYKEDTLIPNVDRIYIEDPFGNRIEIIGE
ncbi:VOC family protein [Robertmurraya beringensis]|uniref:VOC family protein n=1 Tax=Robertmurraya beringensis TaxID=641660 RepID=A0ABV6KW82_9BACI